MDITSQTRAKIVTASNRFRGTTPAAYSQRCEELQMLFLHGPNRAYNALAYEVHIPNDAETLIDLPDVRKYYQGSFQEHEHVITFTSMGYSLIPWDEIDHEDRCKFAELVELYSEGPDFLSPCISQDESNSEFLETHQKWLIKSESAG